jgi:hypothetical protein
MPRPDQVQPEPQNAIAPDSPLTLAAAATVPFSSPGVEAMMSELSALGGR